MGKLPSGWSLAKWSEVRARTQICIPVHGAGEFESGLGARFKVDITSRSYTLNWVFLYICLRLVFASCSYLLLSSPVVQHCNHNKQPGFVYWQILILYVFTDKSQAAYIAHDAHFSGFQVIFYGCIVDGVPKACRPVVHQTGLCNSAWSSLQEISPQLSRHLHLHLHLSHIRHVPAGP